MQRGRVHVVGPITRQCSSKGNRRGTPSVDSPFAMELLRLTIGAFVTTPTEYKL